MRNKGQYKPAPQNIDLSTLEAPHKLKTNSLKKKKSNKKNPQKFDISKIYGIDCECISDSWMVLWKSGVSIETVIQTETSLQRQLFACTMVGLVKGVYCSCK